MPSNMIKNRIENSMPPSIKCDICVSVYVYLSVCSGTVNILMNFGNISKGHGLDNVLVVICSAWLDFFFQCTITYNQVENARAYQAFMRTLSLDYSNDVLLFSMVKCVFCIMNNQLMASFFTVHSQTTLMECHRSRETCSLLGWDFY
jgi:hypothetical protein